MRIQFCGANQTVTGTCHLIESDSTRVLLDFGMFQGPRQQAREFNAWLPDGAERVDAVVLSHGHLDHCGKLPLLARTGFRNPIYCTPGTAEIARIVLEDAGEIQEEDATYLNRRTVGTNEPPIQPIYRRADVHDVLKLFRKVNYGEKFTIGDLNFTMYDAGHILGSAYVVVDWTQKGVAKRLLFTADVGRYNTPIIRDPAPPPGIADYVITESTYGGRSHGPMSEVEPQLLAAVQSCIERGGRLLVPSFAVGRTQTILYYLQKFIYEGKLKPLPIFIDSPMGVEVTRAHSALRDVYDEETLSMIGEKDLFAQSRVTLASSSQQSKQINAQRGPCVIIASSPTCEFGRILHHLEHSVEQPNDLVIFVGWVPPGTLGRRLQDGERRVRIFNRYYEVKCRVETIHGLSAHADGDELVRFLTPALGPLTRSFVVHGELDQAELFAQRLRGLNVGDVSIPATHSITLA